MNKKSTLTWAQYEAGKAYKNRIGLYERVQRNEQFYRGDQWSGSSGELPHPVFNIVRRITDYLVAAVTPKSVAIRYNDERIPFLDRSEARDRVREGLFLLEKNAAFRWKQSRMDALAFEAIQNAVLTGDGIFYCYWDRSAKSGQPFSGDIRTELLNNTNLFVADETKKSIQDQDYIILSGKESVASLRREAAENRVPKEVVKKISADGDPFLSEPRGISGMPKEEQATYLIKFFREDGRVMMEKSVRECVIKRVNTGLHYYPIAAFSWQSARNRFHGISPIDDIIPNQKYINTAYAMAMKHMTDTAFSKVVYDKSRIPEWTNEVGEAIAVLGGGNVSDAVSVVGTGKMQERYLELIDSVIDNTKNMMGATKASLGDAEANNTSAILTLQETSQVALRQVESRFRNCLCELATVWADMLCAYCPPERFLTLQDERGELTRGKPDYALLREELLCATVEVRNVTAYTPAATVAMLDKLLDGGYLSPEDYLQCLPDGCVANPELLVEKVKNQKEATGDGERTDE